MPHTASVFVTFEGGEGAGKSTQVQHLAHALTQAGHDVLLTREPGGSQAAEQIRTILLDPRLQLDALTQVLLFTAARRDHWVKTVAPALAAGRTVICDRFYDSTFAYQGAAGGIGDETTRFLTKLALEDVKPDITIVLDIDPALGMARASKRRGQQSADSFEGRDIAFHKRIREALRNIAAAEPSRCQVFDATLDEVTLASRILDAVTAVLRKRQGKA
jgi:dTMP kinase